ncbi:MAG: hypothetical protein Q8M31_16410 [Beijerinckiaceae bacterium]|nr:hypothetical protein [Beijerinckiaceae bacterium]
MAKKPTHVVEDNTPAAEDQGPGPASIANEVAELRAMSRDDRLRLLTRGLDLACGPLPARRKGAQSPEISQDKLRRKD